MRNIEIHLQPEANLGMVESAIEASLAAGGLEVSLRGTLKKHAGCIHWHAKSPGQSGTLEVTLWPQQRRAWFTIQNGRTADWIAVKVPELQRTLQSRLSAFRPASRPS